LEEEEGEMLVVHVGGKRLMEGKAIKIEETTSSPERKVVAAIGMPPFMTWKKGFQHGGPKGPEWSGREEHGNRPSQKKVGRLHKRTSCTGGRNDSQQGKKKR